MAAVLGIAIIFVLLAAVIALVSAPLRRSDSDPRARRQRQQRGASSVVDAARVGELEAAREAKYREIRDVEMDFRTGKLSEADYQALDAELRAEALEILDGLEKIDGATETASSEE